MLLSCTYLFPFPKAAGHRLVWAVRAPLLGPHIAGFPTACVLEQQKERRKARMDGGSIPSRHSILRAGDPQSTGGSGKENPKYSVIQISNQQGKPIIHYKLTTATNVLRNSSAPSFPPDSKKVPFVLACGFFISHQALPLNHRCIS